MAKKVIGFIMSAMLIVALNVQAAPSVKWVSKTSVATTSVVYDEGCAFVAEGTTVGVYDVTDPAAPVKKATLSNMSNTAVQKLALRGKYLFVGCAQVIRVFDISDKNNMIDIAGYRHGNAYCLGLAVDDNNLYVAAHSNGLKILDVRDSVLDAMSRETAGALRAVYAPATRAIGVIVAIAVQDNYLYVCTNTGAADMNGAFQVYDVSNAAAPVLKAYCQLKHIGNPSLFVRMSSIAIKGNYVYVGTNDQQALTTTSGASNGVYIFDVTSAKANTGAAMAINYSALYQIANITFPRRITQVFVNGDYLYIDDQDAQQIRMYSIKNPTEPVQLYSVKTQSGEKNGAIICAMAGKYLYVADNSAGMAIYQVPYAEITLAVEKNENAIEELEDGDLYAKATVINYTADTKATNVIVAAYKGGVLQSCKVADVKTVGAGKDAEISTSAVNVPLIYDGYTVKAFMFDNALSPLCDAIVK